VPALPLSAKLALIQLISACENQESGAMVLTLHSNDGRSTISSTSFNPEALVTFVLFFFPWED
jgi:hypothetical protein